MTKRENYTELKALATASDRADLVAFIDHELELLDKKNKAPKKATKTQIENENLKDEILKVLAENGEPMTATAIGSYSEKLLISRTPHQGHDQARRYTATLSCRRH